MGTTECPICLDGVREPRMCMDCSNIFCTPCLSKLPQRHNCVICRTEQSLNSYEKVTPAVMKALKRKDKEVEELQAQRAAKQMAAKCEEHDEEQKFFFCEKLKKSVCRKCDCGCNEKHALIEDASAAMEGRWSECLTVLTQLQGRKAAFADQRKKADACRAKMAEITQLIAMTFEEETGPFKSAFAQLERLEEKSSSITKALEKEKKSAFLNASVDLRREIDEVIEDAKQMHENTPAIVKVDYGTLLQHLLEAVDEIDKSNDGKPLPHPSSSKQTGVMLHSNQKK